MAQSVDIIREKARVRNAAYRARKKDDLQYRAGCVARSRRYAEKHIARLDQIKLKAGCVRCGYRKCAAALEFHHKDPQSKLFSLGSRPSHSWSKIQAELDKCIVLCANCHRELHDGDL